MPGHSEIWPSFVDKVDVPVDMLNAVKSVFADISSVSPLLWWRADAQNVSQHTLYGVQHIHTNLTLIDSTKDN